MFTRNIFSISITTLQLTNLDNTLLCEEIKNLQNRENKDLKRFMDLNNPCLNLLNGMILEQSKNILENNLQNTSAEVYLKRVWGNHNFNSDICIPHTHRHSFLSAVYYPKATDAKIHFYSPWTDALLSQVPTDEPKEFNEYNSSYYELYVKTGMLVIFPAHLPHFVPVSTDDRYSIAYDIGLNKKHN